MALDGLEGSKWGSRDELKTPVEATGTSNNNKAISGGSGGLLYSPNDTRYRQVGPCIAGPAESVGGRRGEGKYLRAGLGRGDVARAGPVVGDAPKFLPTPRACDCWRGRIGSASASAWRDILRRAAEGQVERGDVVGWRAGHVVGRERRARGGAGGWVAFDFVFKFKIVRLWKGVGSGLRIVFWLACGGAGWVAGVSPGPR